MMQTAEEMGIPQEEWEFRVEAHQAEAPLRPELKDGHIGSGVFITLHLVISQAEQQACSLLRAHLPIHTKDVVQQPCACYNLAVSLIDIKTACDLCASQTAPCVPVACRACVYAAPLHVPELPLPRAPAAARSAPPATSPKCPPPSIAKPTTPACRIRRPINNNSIRVVLHTN